MADITPGTIHYSEQFGKSYCGVEFTSDWDDDDEAEFIYQIVWDGVNCRHCLEKLKYSENG